MRKMKKIFFLNKKKERIEQEKHEFILFFLLFGVQKWLEAGALI